MKKLIVGSLNGSAGKTSLILGLSKVLGKKIGYLKPFGDRLLYKKKRLWDYDSALVTKVCELSELPEEMSIGFEHAKLRYMYSKDEIKKKLDEMAAHAGEGKDVLFIEGPDSLASGTSINLDIISVATDQKASLVFVVSGGEDTIIDQVMFIHKFVDITGAKLNGIIINKVGDTEDFKNTYLDTIKETGIKVLGLLPYREELTFYNVGFLADGLFAKVLAGEAGLNKTVSRIFVGAMSADTAMTKSYFANEARKLVITGGDRSDMILAALESGSSAIVLTNDLLPPPNIIAKATELEVPLLLVSADTYSVAKQIDEMEPLVTANEPKKVDLLADLVKNNVDLKGLGL